MPNPNEPLDISKLNKLLAGLKGLSNVLPFFIALGAPESGMPGPVLAYFAQMKAYSKKNGLGDEWYKIMVGFSFSSYHGTFEQFKNYRDEVAVITYKYQKDASGLKVPFSSEAEHMKDFETYIKLCFPSDVYKYKVVFGDTPDEPFVSVTSLCTFEKNEAGGFDPISNKITLQTDGVMPHEFLHKLGVHGHHYDNTIFLWNNEKCTFAKTGALCHSCAAATGVDYAAALANDKAAQDMAKKLGDHFFPVLIKPS